MPRISAAPRTSSRTGIASSRTATASSASRASSLRTVATPPRVASRIRCTSPAFSISAQSVFRAAEDVDFEALLEDEAGGDAEGLRPAHREVVDGAVDRQLPDVTAREEDGRDDVRVGGHGQSGPTHLEERLVAGRVSKGGLEERL